MTRCALSKIIISLNTVILTLNCFQEIEAQLSKIEAQCSKIEAQRSKIEALELQNKSISTALEAARCKQESEAASREHVVVMLVVAEDKQVQISGGAQVEETYVEAEVTSEPVSVDDEVMDKSGKHLEAIPEFGSCESPHYSDKDAPVTPPISPGKPAQLDDNALDFDRPIPLHMSWADMVEDDSRWYEDSENEAEQVPTVNIESTAVVAVETRAAEDEAKAPVVEPSEEQGWLSRKGHGEFRAFRAFNHYRASSFGEPKDVCLLHLLNQLFSFQYSILNLCLYQKVLNNTCFQIIHPNGRASALHVNHQLTNHRLPTMGLRSKSPSLHPDTNATNLWTDSLEASQVMIPVHGLNGVLELLVIMAMFRRWDLES